jgi:hypothetical protein
MAQRECDEEPENWVDFVDTHKTDRQRRYYVHNLKKQLASFPDELIDIVADCAADGFRIGQRLDVLDKMPQWCVGEVVDIKDDSVRVHYIGWKEKWDEWFEVSSDRIAKLWTKTCPNGDGKKSKSNTVQYNSRQVGRLVTMGFDQKVAKEVLNRNEGIFQEALNELLYIEANSE